MHDRNASSSPGQQLPPGLAADDRVVLFDGVCKLCGAWARFLIRYDRRRAFKLACVQSPAGGAILAHFGLPTDTFETMLLVEGPHMYTKSTAFLRVMRRLPAPWPLIGVATLIPRALRDWLYDRVALNRYRIFGRFDYCVLPSADHESRFLPSSADPAPSK